MASDTPGREIPKEYRDVASQLVSEQGWRYDAGKNRKGHPLLFPADVAKSPIAIPTTPSKSPRAFKNWLAEIRRAGGRWPVERKP